MSNNNNIVNNNNLEEHSKFNIETCDNHQNEKSQTEYPNPNNPYPVGPIKGVIRTVFLKNIIQNPQIIVGDYTYYDDPEDVYNFERNVLYLFNPENKLIIGKFCQIARGVRFIMDSANHAMNSFSTFPFKSFGGAWQHVSMDTQSKGDTVACQNRQVSARFLEIPRNVPPINAHPASPSIPPQNYLPYSLEFPRDTWEDDFRVPCDFGTRQ
eukprot:gb/GECH01010946.1/.p1 GENE.gb/GECH01010946.1/~~gb/GECH01010946.1/.p1  ORF type:complete len:211 (+),score=20.83 gb/GECH01010946.1/:1-633(+)